MKSIIPMENVTLTTNIIKPGSSIGRECIQPEWPRDKALQFSSDILIELTFHNKLFKTNVMINVMTTNEGQINCMVIEIQ